MILEWLKRLRRPRGGPADPVGRLGEDVAARHLREKGFRLLGRNLRLSFGEVDILAEDPDGTTVVLVEVKTRRVDPDHRTPPAEAAITADKSRKLVALASALKRLNRWQDRPMRIDVIAVDLAEGGPAAVRHHPNAVKARR